METLAIRIYEGRKLLYDEHGKLENKSSVITVETYHYIHKFLEYYHTLGNVKVVLERVYNAEYQKGKNSKETKVSDERFAELKAMLDKKQTKKVEAVADPVAAENAGLKDRVEKLEALIESQAKAKDVPKQTDSKELDDKEKETPVSEPVQKRRRVVKTKKK